MKKRILFYLLFVFLFFSCNEVKETGDDKEAIRKLMSAYTTAVENSDWNTIVKTLPPEIFKYVSREFAETAMSNAFKGKGVQPYMKEMKVDSIYTVVAYNSGKYSLVITHSTIDMTFSDSLIASMPQKRVDDMCENLRVNKDYIDCIIKEKGVIATLIQRFYAIYVPENKKWFCMPIGPDSEMLNKVVPAEVRKKFENPD